MPIEKMCEQCSNAFRVKPSHSAQRFCSAVCKAAYETAHGRAAAQVPLVHFVCRECGAPFSYKPSDVRHYEKKFGKPPTYCSVPCSAIGRRKDTVERQRFTCLQCGKEQSRRRKPGGRVYAQQKFCNRFCKAEHQRDTALKRFNSGDAKRHIKRHGYVYLSVPSRVTGVKHAVLEHRYVMEQHIGRKLRPEETVHHINGNRQDNRIDNLELFSSRHGPGQRVVDKVNFAIEILTLYPEFAKKLGFRLVQDSPLPPESTNFVESLKSELVDD